MSKLKHLSSHYHQQRWRAWFSCSDTSTRCHLRCPKGTHLTSSCCPEEHECLIGPGLLYLPVSELYLWPCGCLWYPGHLKCLMPACGQLNESPAKTPEEPGEQFGRIKWIYWQSCDMRRGWDTPQRAPGAPLTRANIKPGSLISFLHLSP